jgi:Sigma-70, region 4
MSAALQLPQVWGSSLAEAAPKLQERRVEPKQQEEQQSLCPARQPDPGLVFYRKHCVSMLRRYLYASMQVGRAPSILGEPIGRGWVSSRRVRTFEDAVIFVLDVERCLARLSALDRQLLSRVVLQEYTHTEAAALLGMSVRSVSTKLGLALDRLTDELLLSGLLILPD